MNLMELIEALDQRYGNPHAKEQYHLIQEAVIMLQEQQARIAVLEQEKQAWIESRGELLAHNLHKAGQ